MSTAPSVDDYIEHTPELAQPAARQLRKLILATIPGVEEKISYQMPYYSYHGRLVYGAAYKTYIGVYLMTEAREALKDELEPYHSSKATYKFPLNKPLPLELIRRVVKAQAQANEQK